MQCGLDEIFCIKQQPVELDRREAEHWMQIQHWMIVEADLFPPPETGSFPVQSPPAGQGEVAETR